MVLWRDDSKTWRCFEDKCAHRSAPLSEGRIDPADQTIMCSYHGAARPFHTSNMNKPLDRNGEVKLNNALQFQRRSLVYIMWLSLW